jgi:hypothetical protein
MRTAIRNGLVVDSHGTEPDNITPWPMASSEDSMNLAKPILLNVLEVSFESPLFFSIAKAKAPSQELKAQRNKD